jgi:hypothetical protein
MQGLEPRDHVWLKVYPLILLGANAKVSPYSDVREKLTIDIHIHTSYR